MRYPQREKVHAWVRIEKSCSVVHTYESMYDLCATCGKSTDHHQLSQPAMKNFFKRICSQTVVSKTRVPQQKKRSWIYSPHVVTTPENLFVVRGESMAHVVIGTERQPFFLENA